MLNATRLGIAGGIVWGVGLFLTTLLAVYYGYAVNFTTLFIGVYPWYEVSLFGSFVGLICGFIDGFICLFLIAWIYNRLGGNRA